MGVKTYQAYTMAEALAAAKGDLGADAVILETRTFRRGGVLGVRRKTICELTASSSDRADPPRAARTRAIRQYNRVARSSPAPIKVTSRPPTPARTPTLTPAPSRTATPTASDFTRTRRLAQGLTEAHDRRPVDVDPRPTTLKTPTRVARRFILTPADAADAPTTTPMVTAAAAPPEALQQELAAIKTMVGQVLSCQALGKRTPAATMPRRLFEMYLELIGQDLSEELADRIIAAVRAELTEGAMEGDDSIREAVLRHLAELVPAADPTLPCRSPDDRPLTIALIGPTGVGKTTTLAKLAASFKLRHNRKVGLVTCDTYRIAAVEQLRTYAGIIGLPLEVALTPDEMSRAVGRLADCDVVLIDTAGRGPNDSGRLRELRQVLAAADPHEVHLVLSSTASERVLLREADAFADIGADRIVLTKLDEAVSFGVLINVMQSVGKALSFITTGQEVPDHIEAGRPRRLAELVLGAELHG